MNTAIVGVVCSGLTLLVKAIVDLSVERYKKAQSVKEAREGIEARLRSQILLWREHAYAVRVEALKAGVAIDQLPPLPKDE